MMPAVCAPAAWGEHADSRPARYLIRPMARSLSTTLPIIPV